MAVGEYDHSLHIKMGVVFEKPTTRGHLPPISRRQRAAEDENAACFETVVPTRVPTHDRPVASRRSSRPRPLRATELRAAPIDPLLGGPGSRKLKQAEAELCRAAAADLAWAVGSGPYDDNRSHREGARGYPGSHLLL